MRQKTHRPVQFEITEQTRGLLSKWIDKAHLPSCDYLFPSYIIDGYHITTRQYSRIVACWIESIGLNRAAYVTHTLRRAKVTLIVRQPKNFRAVQLLLSHTKLKGTVRYFGIEVDDPLEIAEDADV
jgi:site-specific recombinase XerD